MRTRPLHAASLLCTAVLLIGSAAATARPAQWQEQEAANSFDLSHTLDQRPTDKRFRLGKAEDTGTFRDEKFRPNVSYSLVDGGPTLELGALGSGRKGGPRLAHIKVDWNF